MKTPLSPHFTVEELTHTDHRQFDNTPNTDELANLTRLANFLEQVKTVLGGNPVMVNSGMNMQFTHKPDSMKLFSIAGQEMPVSWRRTGANLWHINLPSATGVYILQVESQGKLYNHRILLDNQ